MKLKKLIVTALAMAIVTVGLVLTIIPTAADSVAYGGLVFITDDIDNVVFDSTAKTVTINTSAPVTVSSTSTGHRIIVADGVDANITLAGVNIDCTSTGNPAFSIAPNSAGDVTVTLKDGTVNTLSSGSCSAGLQKEGEYTTTLGTLTINGGTEGTGILNANGGDDAAGIGGAKSLYNALDNSYKISPTANIVINGGIITAKGGSCGAGIGSGFGDRGASHITVNGGTVTAEGGESGAGIGGGLLCSASDIVITGGSVKATGGIYGSVKAADIGNGTTNDGMGNNFNGTAVTPTDGNGNSVYLTTLDIGSAFTSADIKLNGATTATTYNSHPNNDTKLYFYLPTGYNNAEYNSVPYTAKVETVNTNTFARIYLKVTGGVLGTDYDYINGVVTVKTATALTIENVDKDAATSHRIEVAGGVDANITLADVNIDCSAVLFTSAFTIADYSIGNVTITLKDDTTNTLQSGQYCAGVQKIGTYSTTLGTLTINGETKGTGVLNANSGLSASGIGGGLNGSTANIIVDSGIVNAYGKAGGAGIGGSYNANASHITVNGGTVTAESDASGAGIGGGRFGTATDIVITGGSVKAKGGTYGNVKGADIGNGVYEDSTGNYISGADVTPTDGNGNNIYLTTLDIGSAFTSADIKLNGETTATKYYSHPNDTKLYFYLPEGNYNTCEYDGDVYYAAVVANNNNVFILPELKVTGGVLGTDYDYINGVVTVKTSTALIIENFDKDTATSHRIEVADGVSANITLAGVNIDSTSAAKAAFTIAPDSAGNVSVTLKDGSTNTLKSPNNYAGLQKEGEHTSTLGTLTISGETAGTGILNAIGGYYGAGIGSGLIKHTANIVINGGIINATGGIYGAGIGGGEDGCCSYITINGGIINANSGTNSAGIGGGFEGSCSYITINGGTVTATGNLCGAGIGGGGESYANNFVITGGSVKAVGGSYGADIGNGGQQSPITGMSMHQ